MLTAEAAAAKMDTDYDFQSDLEELKNAFESGGVDECRSMLERKRNEWKSIEINVAVTGNCGVGKSSFINAIRGLTADDKGAAEVGVTETTKEIRIYTHPCNPLLKFWDLPGVGTDRFPRETYLADIDVDRYDFFLLITAGSFTENDTWLGKEIRGRNKKYFFVRTKVAIDISNNNEAHPKTHNEETVVKDIRESAEQHLRTNGCENVPVFLIDNCQSKKFEFDQLERRLVEDLPKLQKSALIMSLQATSEKMIRLKVAELHSRMWKRAISSASEVADDGAVALVFEIGIVTEEADLYLRQLGLDEASLSRYAKLMSCDYRQLKSTVDYSLRSVEIGVSGAKMVEMLFKVTAPFVKAAVLEEGSSLKSKIGQFIAVPLSFAGTYCALKMILKKMESVALEVVKYAAESANDTELSDDN